MSFQILNIESYYKTVKERKKERKKVLEGVILRKEKWKLKNELREVIMKRQNIEKKEASDKDSMWKEKWKLMNKV